MPVAESKPLPEKPAAVKLPEAALSQSSVNGDMKPLPKMETVQVQRKHEPPPQPRTKATDAEADRIIKAINLVNETDFSDVEDVGWAEQMERFRQRSKKRTADVYEGELHKRKVSDPSCVLPHPTATPC